MEIKKFNHLDIELYKEKLNNGLDVYIVPKNDKNDIYVTFTTRFGADILEFVPINEKKFVKMPPGIAHFLEHKNFEQESGEDPFSFFTKNGADANAYTNYDQTTYLFSGPNNFKENLNYLLDYVQSPYFTDENVLKEKGIIEQEIKMYEDNPYFKIDMQMRKNIYSAESLRTPVAGEVSDIYSITKEDLYRCYNTFYNPSNMFIVIVGNVDPYETLEVINDNQNKKNNNRIDKIEVKREIENDKINFEYDEIDANISLPKILISYKFNRCEFNKIPRHIQADILYIFCTINFGYYSDFFEKMQSKQILNFSPSFNITELKNHLILNISFETLYKDIVLKEFDKVINKRVFKEKDFKRYIKSCLCNIIDSTDSIYKINRSLISSIIKNELSYTLYDDYKNVKYEDCYDMIENMNLNNRSILVVNVKKQ